MWECIHGIHSQMRIIPCFPVNAVYFLIYVLRILDSMLPVKAFRSPDNSGSSKCILFAVSKLCQQQWVLLDAKLLNQNYLCTYGPRRHHVHAFLAKKHIRMYWIAGLLHYQSDFIKWYCVIFPWHSCDCFIQCKLLGPKGCYHINRTLDIFPGRSFSYQSKMDNSREKMNVQSAGGKEYRSRDRQGRHRYTWQ